MQNMFGNYYKTNEYYAGSISFVDENGRTEDYRFTQEELDAVMEAVQKDVEAGNMTYYQLYSLRAGDEDNTYRDRYFNNLDISFYNPDGIIWNYSSYSVDGVDVTEAVRQGRRLQKRQKLISQTVTAPMLSSEANAQTLLRH